MNRFRAGGVSLIFLPVIAVLVICFTATFLGGCTKEEDNKAQQKNRLKIPAEAAKQKQPLMTKISDNPAFFTKTAIVPKAPAVRDLDKLLRPTLVQLFEDTKLVWESKAPEKKADGEVVKNRMVYVVRMILTPQEGNNLHAALKKVGFAASPRLGSKPLHYKSTVSMSLMKTTSLGGYSLVILVDAGKQQIEVKSYKLGSKYDRMM